MKTSLMPGSEDLLCEWSMQHRDVLESRACLERCGLGRGLRTVGNFWNGGVP